MKTLLAILLLTASACFAQDTTVKHVIFATVPTTFVQTAGPIINGKLHVLTANKDFDHSQAEYAATWDQKAPYLTVLKGDPKTVTNTYYGWPTVNKATWEAANPVIPVK